MLMGQVVNYLEHNVATVQSPISASGSDECAATTRASRFRHRFAHLQRQRMQNAPEVADRQITSPPSV